MVVGSGIRADKARTARHKRQRRIQSWISKKIKYLVTKEGYPQQQAIAVAYSLARRRFGDGGLRRRAR